MTPFERQVMKYMELRGGTITWAEFRNQFSVSEGYATVVFSSLKAKLLIMQDGVFYGLSSRGVAAMTPQPRRLPFEGRAVW